MTQIQEVKKIATNVRQWAENNRNVAHASFDLCGMCAVASVKLSLELTNRNIPHELAYRKDHVFVLCEDYIVDVTATQFGNDYQTVEVLQRSNVHPRENHWKVTRKFKTVKGLINRLNMERWPKSQIPTIKKLK
jgi:hypothetical protein